MRLALASDMIVIGDAWNGEEALPLAEELNPAVVVMDVEMPRLDGIAATELLRIVAPRRAVVMLSLHDDAATRARAQAAGAAAFVGKSCGRSIG